MEISHLSHCHRLIERPFSGVCDGCETFIRKSTPSYSCEECRVHLHEYCTRLQREIQRSDHHQHPLFLVLNPHKTGHYKCDGCKRKYKGFSYRCSECDFNLDLECALQNLDPTPAITFKHRGHPLVLSNQPTVGDWKCVVCDERLEIPLFKCKDHGCKYRMHLHCAPLTFPETVDHWKHRYRKHPLVLSKRFLEDETGEYYCESCEQRRHPDHPVYYCNQCSDPYIAHMACALSNEVLQTLAEAYGNSATDNAPVDDEHPSILTLVDSNELARKRCTACNLAFRDYSLILTCQQRDVYLHKKCGEVAREIQHPGHTKHSLTLLAKEIHKGSLFKCNACKELRYRYIYQCCHCRFNLCVGCNFLLHPTEIKYLNHRLFHFNSSIKGEKCDRCGEISSSPSFICMEPACTYNLHSHCAPFDFPKTTKHKNHEHPLSYMNCSSGTPCFICDDKPQRDYPVYCCKQCDKISHLSCALLEKLPELFANYEYSTSDEKAGKLDAELERIQTKEEEMKAQLIEISKSIEAMKVARLRLVELHDASQDDQMP